MGRLRDDNDMHPETGVRFLFELATSEGASASYKVAVFSPDAVVRGEATLQWDNDAVVSGFEDDTLTMVTRFCTVISRNAKRAQEMRNPWPQRVVRWRDN